MMKLPILPCAEKLELVLSTAQGTFHVTLLTDRHTSRDRHRQTDAGNYTTSMVSTGNYQNHVSEKRNQSKQSYYLVEMPCTDQIRDHDYTNHS